jgi:hypothetical protein
MTRCLSGTSKSYQVETADFHLLMEIKMSDTAEKTGRIEAIMQRDVAGVPVAMILCFASAFILAVGVAVMCPIS